MLAESIHVVVPGAFQAADRVFRSGPEVGPDLLFASLGAVVLIVLLLSGLAAAALIAYRTYIADPEFDDESGDELPPLVFPVAGPPRALQRQARPAPSRPAASAPMPSAPAPSGRDAGPLTAALPPSPGPPPGSPPGTASAAGSPAVEEASSSGPSPGAGARAGTPARRPRRAKTNGARSAPEVADGLDATLQLMPGRLEVVGGDAGTEEIRFVRPPGGDAVVTLGRNPGATPAHVQLRNPTVSRTHARLRFEGGTWRILNLSHTNPALLNGQALPVEGGEHILQDGDRLELGEVVLRFRCR